MRKCNRLKVVQNEKLLKRLKEKGIICGYCGSGCLENQTVCYTDESFDGIVMTINTYAGPEIKEGDLGSNKNPYRSIGDIPREYTQRYLMFEFEGRVYRSMYVPGLFSQCIVRIR